MAEGSEEGERERPQDLEELRENIQDKHPEPEGREQEEAEEARTEETEPEGLEELRGEIDRKYGDEER